jgi:hypothetical protein
MLISNALTREPCTGARSGENRSRATPGAEPRQGNSRYGLEADRKIDARFSDRESPRRNTDMREPANKSLLTDVSRLCSYRCTIIVHQLLWRFRRVQHVARAVLDVGHKSP